MLGGMDEGNISTSGEPPIEQMSFEQALSALEGIVQKLERGDVPLDQSISLYERGEQLRAACQKRLDAAQVVTEAASADHVRLLRHYWQLPMYHLDFKEAAVPLETLQADREAQLWAEAGYGPEYG